MRKRSVVIVADLRVSMIERQLKMDDQAKVIESITLDLRL
jgi:hypothetical protein